MNEIDIRARVRELVGSHAPQAVVEVSSAASLAEDLQYDSVSLLELAIALEQEFKLPPLPDERVLDIESVRDIEELIVEQLTEVRS